jgi:hypothetical protein
MPKKSRVRIGVLLLFAIAPWVEQLLFNRLLCGYPWYAYYPLLMVTSSVPLGWLVLEKRIPGFVAASIVQTAVLFWFNWVSCHMGVPDVDYFPGESRFVGGLGTLYALTFSTVGGLFAGGAACLLFRKRS